MAITSGVWYTASVFLVALIQEFGWDYASTASIFSLFTILYGVSGVLVGYLVDRIGPRRVVLASGALLAVALLGNSLATTRWHLYLTHSAFTALGLSGMGWVPVSVILARGFRRRRGLALGIASAGVGAGMTIFVPMTQAIIDRGGWRMAFVALAVISIAVILPVGLFALRDAAMALAGGGEGAQAPSPSAHWAAGPPVWTPVAAIRSGTFWLVAGTFVFLNSPVQMVLTHHVAHLVGVGQPKIFVAGIAGLVGLASVAGKILWGYLSDRWWVEATYLAGIAFLVAGIATLLAMGPATPAWRLYGYAALMGIGYAVSPAMTPVLSARFFAGRHFGAIFGALNLVHHVGGAAGMWLAGLARDVTGNYTLPFLLAIASACLSLACVWLAAPRRLLSPNNPC
jgi:MFS family permease